MNYQEYLQIEKLLKLQKPLSDGPEHDEPLFIVIHQVYELWFKILLHEGEALSAYFTDNEAPKCIAVLKRIRTILKTLVSQVDVLETMTPLSFSSFRDRLASSSGFQSLQFRQFEFVLGEKKPQFLKFHEEGSDAYKKLEALMDKPSLYDKYLEFIHRRGFTLPDDVLSRDYSKPHKSHEDIVNALLKVYKEDPLAEQVSELMVDVDEGIQEWRYRHVKMVERTIGGKSGTGGSSGAEYLKRTLFKPLFPDLWEVRGLM